MAMPRSMAELQADKCAMDLDVDCPWAGRRVTISTMGILDGVQVYVRQDGTLSPSVIERLEVDDEEETWQQIVYLPDDDCTAVIYRERGPTYRLRSYVVAPRVERDWPFRPTFPQPQGD